MAALDWPVRRGGAAIVSAGGVEHRLRPGTAPEDRFPVASVTKLLTTLGALAAVEHGDIALEDPVPDVPGATVRHLLAHASGLPVEGRGPGSGPGRRRVYSNTGFRALASMVEQATGTPFARWLEERVIEPLELAGISLEAYAGVAADPAAGAVATLEDLEWVARCLLDKGAPVIGEDLFRDAVTVQFPGLDGVVPGVGRFHPCDWGLGFELHDGKSPHWMGDRRSPAAFGHFGATGCFIWVDSEAGVAVAGVSDRPFGDDRWAMQVWPGWSDTIG